MIPMRIRSIMRRAGKMPCKLEYYVAIMGLRGSRRSTFGTLTAMATSSDPTWWEYHFSQLGTFGDRSSSLFNLTLIIAGFFVTTFAVWPTNGGRSCAPSAGIISCVASILPPANCSTLCAEVSTSPMVTPWRQLWPWP